MLHVYMGAIKEWRIESTFCGFLGKPELYAPTIPRGFTHTYSKMCRNVTRKISIRLHKDNPIIQRLTLVLQGKCTKGRDCGTLFLKVKGQFHLFCFESFAQIKPFCSIQFCPFEIGKKPTKYQYFSEPFRYHSIGLVFLVHFYQSKYIKFLMKCYLGLLEMKFELLQMKRKIKATPYIKIC